jgi:hypothetical protein
MDAGEILVAVLTSAAVGWLIWVEIHSRRNAAAQSVSQPPIAAETRATSEERVPPLSRPVRRRNKARVRSA